MIYFGHYGYKPVNFKCCRNGDRGCTRIENLKNLSYVSIYRQGCGVGVAKSRSFLGGVADRFLRGTARGVGFHYPTPGVQLNYFLHRAPKLGALTRAC